MDRRKLINRFKLDNNGISHKQINPITRIEFYTVIPYGKLNLAFHFEPTFQQLMFQARFVGTFQQSRPQR